MYFTFYCQLCAMASTMSPEVMYTDNNDANANDDDDNDNAAQSQRLRWPLAKLAKKEVEILKPCVWY